LDRPEDRTARTSAVSVRSKAATSAARASRWRHLLELFPELVAEEIDRGITGAPQGIVDHLVRRPTTHRLSRRTPC
jgi:hypothetical protein